jgi:hypothetical protein
MLFESLALTFKVNVIFVSVTKRLIANFVIGFIDIQGQCKFVFYFWLIASFVYLTFRVSKNLVFLTFSFGIILFDKIV